MDKLAAIAAGRIRIRGTPDRAVTVPTTGVELLPPNPNRIGWYANNQDSGNFAVVAHRPLAVSTLGARLDSNGGSYGEQHWELGDSVCDPVYACANTAQLTLHVTEWEVY